MIHKRVIIGLTLGMLLQANAAMAENFKFVEMPKLHVDSLPTQLSYPTQEERLLGDLPMQRTAFSIAKDAIPTTRQIKPYKFMDDMTFVGVPLFVAGIIAKSEKESFRQDYNNQSARSRLIKYNFHNTLDNYTQFAPMILSTGLNLAGVEGRSSLGRYFVSGAMSYAIMAAIVNPIKYTAKEMRPDGSTRNSWPSGHTATAFVSATILHKEYGLTRSPWYSVAGYGLATMTGVMRVLNNRHWVSDVLSGAGIGIFSTELAYGLTDLMFKGKGLKRNDLVDTHNIIENPSFFSISMGIGLGSKNLEFQSEDIIDDDLNEVPIKLQFRSSTVVGAEGAYFFNKNIGIGGRLRVCSTPINGWTNLADEAKNDLAGIQDLGGYTDSQEITIESDHITEFTGDVGVYFNFPLSSRFALGTKLLVGRSITQDLDINAKSSGKVRNLIYDGNVVDDLSSISYDDLDKLSVSTKDETYESSWDYVTVSGKNSMKYGTGISLTYAYKSSFSWKVFVDYDFTRKNYTLEYSPLAYYEQAFPAEYKWLYKNGYDTISCSKKKNMNTFVIGGAFCISF